MTYLMKTGRWSGRIRKDLRAYLDLQPNQNAFINRLIENDMVMNIVEERKNEAKYKDLEAESKGK
jgi:hypothetical protein